MRKVISVQLYFHLTVKALLNLRQVESVHAACGSARMRLLPRYYCALRWNSGLTRQMSVLATEEMSGVETG